MNSSDIVEAPGSILSTPQTQTQRQNEYSPNARNQTTKRSGSGNSLGISYCCFWYIEYSKIPLTFTFNSDSYWGTKMLFMVSLFHWSWL